MDFASQLGLYLLGKGFELIESVWKIIKREFLFVQEMECSYTSVIPPER